MNNSAALFYLGTGQCEVLAAGLPDTKLLLSESWDGVNHLSKARQFNQDPHLAPAPPSQNGDSHSPDEKTQAQTAQGT